MGFYNVQLHLDKNPCLQIKECKINDSVFLFSSKMYVVGTQKNHLSERFYFLSTGWIIIFFHSKIFEP